MRVQHASNMAACYTTCCTPLHQQHKMCAVFNKLQGITINTPESYGIQILARSLAIMAENLSD
jgi:hypothetical protein